MYSAESARIASGRALAAVQAEYDRYRAVTSDPEPVAEVAESSASAVADAFHRAADFWALYRPDAPLATTYRRVARAWRAEAATYAAPVSLSVAGWS